MDQETELSRLDHAGLPEHSLRFDIQRTTFILSRAIAWVEANPPKDSPAWIRWARGYLETPEAQRRVSEWRGEDLTDTEIAELRADGLDI